LITEKGIGSVIRFFKRNKEKLAVGALNEAVFEKNFNKANKPMEEGMFDALRFVLRRWSNRLTRIFGRLPKNILKNPPTEAVDRVLNEANKHMNAKELSEMVQETLIDAYRTGSSMNNLAEVVLDGAGIKFEKADPFAIDWLNNRTLNLADNFIDQYSNKIKDKVSEAMDRGLGIGDTVDLLKTVIPYNIRVGETQAAWKKRVKSFDSKLKEIARTEVIMASNRGRLMQLKNLGATHWKYHAFKDERNVNEYPLLIAGKKVTCRDLHDETDVYALDDTRFLPPIHPNCRCSIHGVYNPTEKSIGKGNPQGAVMGGDGSGGTPISNVRQHPSSMDTPALVRALGGLQGSKPTPENLTRRQEIEGELNRRKEKGEDVCREAIREGSC